MKKLILTATVVSLAAGASFAQESEYKPTSGSKTLEANINIFGLGETDEEKKIVSLSNGLNQIKGRYFLNEATALRLGFNVGLSTQTTPGEETGDKRTERIFTFSVMPGIEKHFEGTERLSPFIGAEIGIGIDSRKTTEIAGDETFVTTGEAQGGVGSFAFGLNALAGFDYYLARSLFVGYELGFGINVVSDSDVVVDGETANEGGTHFEIGPNVRNGIRVGFVF